MEELVLLAFAQQLLKGVRQHLSLHLVRAVRGCFAIPWERLLFSKQATLGEQGLSPWQMNS